MDDIRELLGRLADDAVSRPEHEVLHMNGFPPPALFRAGGGRGVDVTKIHEKE